MFDHYARSIICLRGGSLRDRLQASPDDLDRPFDIAGGVGHRQRHAEAAALRLDTLVVASEEVRPPSTRSCST